MVFILSKALWVVAAPGNLLLLLVLWGAARLLASRGKRGLRLVLLAAVLMLATATLPVAEWLAAPLENRFPALADEPQRVDGIVLLGGAIHTRISQSRGRVAVNDAADRMVGAVELARRHPEARILVTGGDGSVIPRGLHEADFMRVLLIELGIAPERIVLERESRNTWENAVDSLAVAKPAPGETWLLVTTAMHMPRSVGCFRRAGWGSIIPFPVDYRTTKRIVVQLTFGFPEDLGLLNLVVREWDGLVAYYALGRTDALFPAPAPG
jgi:uncharacterized SAM-binding protein YcdF (DUF218 family)